MLINNETAYRRVGTELAKHSSFVIDVETNGLDSFNDHEICGVGVSPLESEDSYYFPVRHQQGQNLPMECYQDLLALLSLSTSLIGYNIKFDLHFLIKDGLKLNHQKLEDVIVMVRLTEDTTVKDLSLTNTLKRSYGEEAAQYDVDLKKYLRTNKWHKDFSMAPPDILGAYCEQDVLCTRKLYVDRLKLIKESNQTAIWNLEIALTTVLLLMEARGIMIDSGYAQESIDKIQERKEALSQKIFSLVGEFNINSTQQLGEVLNNNGIFSPRLTPKGKQSWDEASLIRINNPIAGLVRQYRTLEKLRSTYLEPHLETTTLHTGFCNWGTVTGRLSSRNPNLQNIPRNHFKLMDRTLEKDELEDARKRVNALVAAKGGTGALELDDEVLDTWGFIGDESFDAMDSAQIAIRRLFVPRPNTYLVSFDYSQMEVRVFLSYIKNDTIKELLYKDEVDFHSEAAKLAFNVDEEHPEFKFFRQMAKAITFGTIYGIGNKKLALQLGITPKEAGQYKKQYFAGLPGSKEFFNSVVRAVEARGWIKNRYGRIYHVPMDKGYKGVNYLVQGTSADILNERMIAVKEVLANTKSHLLVQVHDEVICEIPHNEIETSVPLIKETLKQNSLNIPLHVDMDICDPSWASKKILDMANLNGYKPKERLEDYIDWEAF